MNISTWLQDGVLLLVILLLVKPVGIYLKRVFAREQEEAYRNKLRLISRLFHETHL